ncbi:ABC transporter ATP-binding protein [Candidatus Berkelbacteria bacterium]|nr:ABC transporter ATP-binding protein [Candidatus Berkelbacteria bacterium]
MIKVTDLHKSFYHQTEPQKVLDGVNLQIDKGDVFGLVGQNGAGKSTLINIMLGLLSADSGSVLFQSKNSTSLKAKQIYGAMSEQPKFYEQFSATETLAFVGKLYKINTNALKEKIPQLLELVDLSSSANNKVKSFSKGMHQRLALACALINEPKILILDEPFDGLDPIGRRLFKQIILEQKSRGVTIFFSSHILSDVQEICTKVGVIINGKIEPIPLSKKTTKDELENKLLKILNG